MPDPRWDWPPDIVVPVIHCRWHPEYRETVGATPPGPQLCNIPTHDITSQGEFDLAVLLLEQRVDASFHTLGPSAVPATVDFQFVAPGDPTLADELARVTGHRLSVSEVGRILRNAELRPHRVRQWLHSPDPDFEAKAKKVRSLYLEPPPGAVVLCIDEKPMQVLERIHPTHVDPISAHVRYEFEYKRHGVQHLLAAYDIRTGRVVSRIVPERTAAATLSFMDEVARRYRGREVYVVWDNPNTHCDGKTVQRWSDFNERHGGRFHFVYTPKHASWMNQVEIWFSILQRRVLQHGDFATKERQRSQVEAFIRHWNRVEHHPFRWTWRVPEGQNRRVA